VKTFYTSLPPSIHRPVSSTDFGPIYQRACVESWCRAGFKVVSINTIDEIAALRDLGYPVEFAICHSSPPSIGDFLRIIRESGEKVAGIVNADCLLVDLPNVLAAVACQAEDGMVLIERLNIDPSTLRPSGELCYGFDAFFFQTEIIDQIEIPDALRIGHPWWDYWLPVAFAAAGTKLMSIEAPLLVHLDHDRKWNQERWLENGQRMLEWLLAARTLPREFESLIRDFRGKEVFAEDDLSRFAQKCFSWLRLCAETQTLVVAGEWSDFILRVLHGAGGSPEQRLRREISELTVYLAEARGKIFRLEGDRKIHLSLLESSNAEVNELESQLRTAKIHLEAAQAELNAVHEIMRHPFLWRILQPFQRIFSLWNRIASKET
jgi:hypothetical protein